MSQNKDCRLEMNNSQSPTHTMYTWSMAIIVLPFDHSLRDDVRFQHYHVTSVSHVTLDRA